MLEIENLQLIRAGRSLLQNLSFKVPRGSVLQITGANGCGKTSLLRTLCGFTPADAGEIRWQGDKLATCLPEYYLQLCYVGHQTALNANLSVQENLQFYARLLTAKKLKDCSEILETFGLTAQQHSLTQNLSAGQKQRLALARLQLSNRALWILDEPFTALDNAAINTLKDLFKNHSNNGGSVIFTSHQVLSLENLTKLALA